MTKQEVKRFLRLNDARIEHSSLMRDERGVKKTWALSVQWKGGWQEIVS